MVWFFFVFFASFLFDVKLIFLKRKICQYLCFLFGYRELSEERDRIRNERKAKISKRKEYDFKKAAKQVQSDSGVEWN